MLIINDSSVREAMDFMQNIIAAQANDDRSRIVKLAFLFLVLNLEIGLVKKIAAIPEPQHPFPDDMYNNGGTASTADTSQSSNRRAELPPVVPSTLVNFLTQWLHPKFKLLTRGQLKTTNLQDFVIDAVQNYVLRLPPMFPGIMDAQRATPDLPQPN
jgi:hypothetical protein